LEDVKGIGRLWFGAGVVTAGLLLFGFTSFLLWNAASALLAIVGTSGTESAQISHIQPLIPGINVPVADTFLLIVAIAVSALAVSLAALRSPHNVSS
jgi:hypothetical protein